MDTINCKSCHECNTNRSQWQENCCQNLIITMQKADSGIKVWCTVSLEVFHCDQKERWDSFIALTKVLKLFLFSPETWSEQRERSPNIGLLFKCLSSICGDDDFALCFALCKAIGHNQLTNSIKALSVCLNKTEWSGNIISRLPIISHFKKTLHLTFFFITVKYMLNWCLTEIDEYK